MQVSALRTLARAALLFALSCLICLSANSQEPAAFPWRISVLSVPSKTYSGVEFLRGGAAGRDVMLAGELRLPFAVLQGKVPAVVLVHGSGGIASNADSWARLLNEAGIAVFILDSFSGRGIVSTVEDQSQLDSVAMMYDAYRALDVLAANPSILPNKIAVMGFSKSAVAAVFSSAERFRKAYGGNNTFAAHVGLYTPCNTRFEGDTNVSSAPIRLFHGVPDDYVSVAPCRDFVAQLKQAGANATLVEYDATQHAYDVPSYPPIYEIKKAVSTRNCRIMEGPGGTTVNATTKEPYKPGSDSCVAIGAHIGYNPTSAAATQQEVLALFRQALLK